MSLFSKLPGAFNCPEGSTPEEIQILLREHSEKMRKQNGEPDKIKIPEGLSTDERREFLKQCAEDTYKYNENKRLKKRIEQKEYIEQEKERKRTKYDYSKKLDMDEDDVPHFMKSVFSLPQISFHEKDLFIENFCIKYFNCEPFRDYNDGRMLFFEDNKFNRIVDSMARLDSETFSDRTLINIGDDIGSGGVMRPNELSKNDQDIFINEYFKNKKFEERKILYEEWERSQK